VPLLHVDVRDRVGILTLDDPARRNSLSLELCEELAEAVERLERDVDCGAIVVTGAGPAFCAGADLSQLGASRRDGLLRIYEGFLRVARSTLPTVAAVNGPAVGAGMNLALACDLRVAGASARFDTRFMDLGIHPGGGHTWMFDRIAGAQTTNAAVLFGQTLDGAEAARVGLAWRCVDDGSLLETAVGIAARPANSPPELVRRIKRTIREMPVIESHEAAVERELTDQLWSMDQPEFAARLASLQGRIRGGSKSS
jgi:enoyl-CoA hydratase